MGLSLLVLASCVASGEPKRLDPLSLESLVLDTPRRAADSRGPLAWDLGGPADAPERVADAPQDPQETPAQRDARLRVQFGSSVLISADGSVTKQYFMAGDLAQTFLKLINEITPETQRFDAERKPPPVPPPGTKVGGAANQSVLGRMLRDHEVEVTFVPDFEILSGANLVDTTGAPAVRGEPLNTKFREAPSIGLALVTAKPAALVAFEAALDLFYSSIPQVEILVSVVEYQTADALAFGVRGATNTSPVLTSTLPLSSVNALARA